ncbi:hypothetical protein E3N88_13563 [Mikania micrantha]|uniref:Uncharacterized protein n=1 Tax=Mikania micrantha TaxID=192012 RepID=A0A5N6PAQ0_9ASTR|nr:hypothetical protein E3N88_13563 [Mikania micrantha]
MLLIVVCHGDSEITSRQKQQSSAGVVTNGCVEFPMRIERSVYETGSYGDNSSSILAEKRTRRKPPLNDFRYYNGGWNWARFAANGHGLERLWFRRTLLPSFSDILTKQPPD